MLVRVDSVALPSQTFSDRRWRDLENVTDLRI
jgi:hypothetical protein